MEDSDEKYIAFLLKLSAKMTTYDTEASNSVEERQKYAVELLHAVCKSGIMHKKLHEHFQRMAAVNMDYFFVSIMIDGYTLLHLADPASKPFKARVITFDDVRMWEMYTSRSAESCLALCKNEVERQWGICFELEVMLDVSLVGINMYGCYTPHNTYFSSKGTRQLQMPRATRRYIVAQELMTEEKLKRSCLVCISCHEAELSMCSRCKMMRYCCAKCQNEDWPFHKMECELLKSLKEKLH